MSQVRAQNPTFRASLVGLKIHFKQLYVLVTTRYIRQLRHTIKCKS